MGRENSPLGFIVALFDVMGFESRLNNLGIDEILNRYMNIVSFVEEKRESNRVISEKLNITGPIGSIDGIAGNFYDTYAVYSSDSILLWANLAWKIVQTIPYETLEKNKDNPAYGHFSNPVPLEPFLSNCAEILCRSIEFDLPLRGAVAMGDAVLDESKHIFIGKPIVDAARLESKQNCIGLSISNSYNEQNDHNTFFLPYNKHFKKDYIGEKKEFALNWPLYWKNSRKDDLKLKILEVSKNNNNHEYYTNTLEFIEYSENFKY